MVVSELQAMLQDPLGRVNTAFHEHIQGGETRPDASTDYGVRELVEQTFSGASQGERVGCIWLGFITDIKYRLLMCGRLSRTL